MEVTGKTLLNSAHNILKNKNQSTAQNQSLATSSVEAKSNDSDLGTTLNAQVLRLQASLSAAQKNHSRAQAQISFLNSNDKTSPEEIMFEDKPLFPDFPYGKNINEYKSQISNNVVDMAQKLKSLQIEMENVFAFSFDTTPDMNLDADALAQVKGLTSLDPGRVAKLTQT